MNDDMDDLDRAIAALPFASPPPGLRAAILRRTVDAPSAPSALAFKMFDIVTIGVALALAVWLAAYVVAVPGAGSRLSDAIASLSSSLADPRVIAWLAAGAVVSILPFVPLGARRLDRNA